MNELINQPAELQKVEIVSTNVFANKESFDHIQRVATMFSKSDMVPKRYIGNVGNCIIALEMANRMNANILMVMQNLDVIQGKPGWSSKFLIATLNACGKFSPLRYESDDKNGGRTRAVAIDKATGELLAGAWVSMDMAKVEGWIDKAGSKWKTMPELMIRYRAASFFTNQFAPEVSMGLQTMEEIIDITPMQERVEHDPAKIATNKERDRIIAHVESAKSLTSLREVVGQFAEDDKELSDLFNSRFAEIENEA